MKSFCRFVKSHNTGRFEHNSEPFERISPKQNVIKFGTDRPYVRNQEFFDGNIYKVGVHFADSNWRRNGDSIDGLQS